MLICVATGTGIAPFRSFWRRCFFENVPSYKFTGLFWLFMGAANSDGKLYDDELQAILATSPENFRVDYALSRESQSEWHGLLWRFVGLQRASGAVVRCMQVAPCTCQVYVQALLPCCSLVALHRHKCAGSCVCAPAVLWSTSLTMMVGWLHTVYCIILHAAAGTNRTSSCHS